MAKVVKNSTKTQQNAGKTIRIACEAASLVSLSKFIPLQGTLKVLSDEDRERLKNSILEHGFSFPFQAWKEPGTGKMYIIDAHQRYDVLKTLEAEGYKIPQLPTAWVHAKDRKDALRKLLAAASQYGKVEAKGLNDILQKAKVDIETALKQYKFPEVDLKALRVEFFNNPDKEKFEDVIPSKVATRSKPGQLWQLGNHRLLCGDSTNKDDIKKLFGNAKADVCFTSPPYADQREYNGGKELSTEYLATFISAAKDFCAYFAVNLGYSRKNGEIFPYWDDYIKEAKKAGLKLLSWNIWDRASAFSLGQQTAMFPIEHEWIFVFGETTFDLNLTVPNKHAGDLGASSNRQTDGSLTKKIQGVIRSHRPLGTVIRCDVDRDRSIDHPAKFPVALPESYIHAMTEVGEYVYEPFCGSGSTLIACEKTERKCVAMELDPKYCDIILERWEKYSGKKAVKL